jgi:hypothetical protein
MGTYANIMIALYLFVAVAAIVALVVIVVLSIRSLRLKIQLLQLQIIAQQAVSAGAPDVGTTSPTP